MEQGTVKPGWANAIRLTQPNVAQDLLQTTKDRANLLGISISEVAHKVVLARVYTMVCL
jgi:hypothetical protein